MQNLFPQFCVLCGRELFFNGHSFPICNDCLKKLVPITGDICQKCGRPLISESNQCLNCRDTDSSCERNISVFRFQGHIRELIYQYKFHGQKQLSYFFAEQLYRYIMKFYPGRTVVPVPGRIIVKRKRGWEHVDLIAEILKGKYSIPVLKPLKRMDSSSQKKLNKAQRITGSGKSITLKKGYSELPHKILVIDDVYTTGATVNYCASVLKKNSANLTVESLTIAMD